MYTSKFWISKLNTRDAAGTAMTHACRSLCMTLVAMLALAGYQQADTTVATHAVAGLSTAGPLAGRVMGGRQPITGANVYVYDASATVGTAAVQIGSAVSDSQGIYSVDSFNPTPADGDLIYVVSVGGNAGAGVNSTATLLAVAGIYDASTQTLTHPATVLNELTTVASLSKLITNVTFPACSTLSGNTQSIGTCVNVQASSAGGWARVLSSIDALANVSSGVAGAAGQSSSPGTNDYTNMTTLNLEASVLANCINSTGGSQGDNSACGNLFATANNGVAQGGLTYLGGGYATGNSPLQVAITPNGNFLYVSNNANSAYVSNLGTTITGYAINSDGSLTPLSGSPFTTGAGPKSVVITPDGKYLYVNIFNDKTIWGYSIDAFTGNLTALTGTNMPYNSNLYEGGSPNAIAVDPSGQYLAIASTTNAGFATINADGSLSHYGNLTNAPGKTVAGDSYSAVVAGTSQVVDSQFQVKNFISAPKIISIFAVADTGSALSQNFYCNANYSCHSLTAGRNVSGVSLTADGYYMYMVNRNDNTISIFYSNITNVVYNTANSTYYSGLYNVRNFYSNTPATLTLSGNGPRSVHVSGNQFVYVTNAGGNSVTTTPASTSGNVISVYQINSNTGLLTEITGSPFFTDTSGAFNSTTKPDFMALHPNGRYAYVLRQGKNDLAVFAVGTINPLMAYAQMLTTNSSDVINKLFASAPVQNPVYSPLPSAPPSTLIPQ